MNSKRKIWKKILAIMLCFAIMGGWIPLPEQLETVMETVLEPTLDAKAAEGAEIFYFGDFAKQKIESSAQKPYLMELETETVYLWPEGGVFKVGDKISFSVDEGGQKVISVTPGAITITGQAGETGCTITRTGVGSATLTATITRGTDTFTVQFFLTVQFKIGEPAGQNYTKFVNYAGLSAIVLDREKGVPGFVAGLEANVDVLDPNTLVWSSDNTNVVDVVSKNPETNISKEGKLTVKGAGSTFVYATAGAKSGVTYNQKIRVYVPPQARPQGSTESKDFTNDNKAAIWEITEGFPYVFDTNSVKASDMTWAVYDVPNGDTTTGKYTKTDKMVVTPSNNGSACSIDSAKAGTYLITATIKDGVTSDAYYWATTMYIYVKVNVKLSDKTLLMNVGDTYDILENINVAGNGYFDYIVSTGSALIVSVDPVTGIITAEGTGSATVKVVPNEKKFAEIGIVPPDPSTFTIHVVDGLEINLPEAIIYVGGQLYLTAITADKTAVKWSSSDKSIATVDPETGLVKALKVGTVTITAKQKIATGVTKKATSTIYVKDSITKITLTPSKATLNYSGTTGDNLTITATTEPAGIKSDLRWVTSDESIVKILDPNLTGNSTTVQAVAGGVAVIMAINPDNVVVGSCRITVQEKVTSVVLSETNMIVSLKSKTVQLNATVLPATATNKTILWTTTNKKVATVNKNGTVKLVGSGTVAIIATSENNPLATAMCTITVGIPVVAVGVDEPTKTLNAGDKYRVTHIVSPINATDKTVTWSSSNTKVATVDANGLVIAKSAGEAVITVKTNDGGYTKTCTITVKQGATGLKLDTTDLTLYMEDYYFLQATVTPANSTSTLTWESTNPKAVVTDQKGKIIAKGAGTATIIVKSDTGQTAYCNVKVLESVNAISLNYNDKTIKVGKSFRLKATLDPITATNQDVTWTSLNTKIATVNENGVVKGKKGGIAAIKCETNDGGYQAFCIVTVKESVTEIKLNYDSYKLAVNKSLQLVATITNSSASNQKVRWKSSNSKVASVNSKGKVTAEKIGSCTITAIATDGSEVEAFCEIEVVKPVTSIKLSKQSITLIEGKSTKIKATVQPGNATYKSVKWTTEDKTIAMVTADGTVTALKAGTVMLKATAKDGTKVSAYCFVNVIPNTPATKIVLSSTELVMVTGETATVQRTVSPSGSTDNVTWASDNSGVATVDKNTGRITAIAPGMCYVTAITTSGKTASTKIIVVGLNKTNIVLQQYTSYTLSVTGVNTGIIWDTDDPEIAIMNNGKVSGRKIGTTYVTAIVNGRRLRCRVTVTEIQ